MKVAKAFCRWKWDSSMNPKSYQPTCRLNRAAQSDDTNRSYTIFFFQFGIFLFPSLIIFVLVHFFDLRPLDFRFFLPIWLPVSVFFLNFVVSDFFRVAAAASRANCDLRQFQFCRKSAFGRLAAAATREKLKKMEKLKKLNNLPGLVVTLWRAVARG